MGTLSGLLASIYSGSRLYDMLRGMGQTPGLPTNPRHQSLIIDTGLAIVLAALLDLGQIASIDAILYLATNVAIHWGIIQHLRADIGADPFVPAIAIGLDLVVLRAFLTIKLYDDLLILCVALGVATLIAVSQIAVVTSARPGQGLPQHSSRTRGRWPEVLTGDAETSTRFLMRSLCRSSVRDVRLTGIHNLRRSARAGRIQRRNSPMLRRGDRDSAARSAGQLVQSLAA